MVSYSKLLKISIFPHRFNYILFNESVQFKLQYDFRNSRLGLFLLYCSRFDDTNWKCSRYVLVHVCCGHCVCSMLYFIRSLNKCRKRAN